MKKGYKYRIYPNAEQRVLYRCTQCGTVFYYSDAARRAREEGKEKCTSN